MHEASELHLLIIEDNHGDADLLREYLHDVPGRRFRSSHVIALHQALARLPDDSIDLIVLDLNLPDSMGIETILQIHQAAPRTPVVVLSGIADDELGHRAIKAGAQDFLHKNALDSSSLARSLRHATERGRLQGQIRSLVENNADAIVVVNSLGVVTYLNQAAEVLFGRGRQEIVGESFGFPVGDGDAIEIVFERAGGERRYADIRAARIDWEGEPAWLATLRDTTDRKRADELQRRLYHAERLAAIGQLASGVAHEINNPAAFVYANLAVMKEQVATLDEELVRLGAAEDDPARVVTAEMRRMLADNVMGIERIASTARAVSAFSRLDRDEIDLVDINDILDIASVMTRNEIRHRAALRRNLGVVPPIAADGAKLAQVFTNLLLNAVHSIAPGAADTNWIEVTTTTAADGRLRVLIEDTGCGIEPANLDKIFEPFFTTKPRGQGTGLGLALSAEIIRKHRGEFLVTSEVGKGTRFEVLLPVDTGLQVTRAEPVVARQPAVTTRGRVLAIDDERMLLEAIHRILRRRHDVVLAENGADAIAELERDWRFDVVLCDLLMPAVDGIRFYQIVSERWPELRRRIVFCSGGAFTHEARHFVAQIQAEHVVIEKPVGPKALSDAVDRVLEQHGLLSDRS